MLTSFTSAGHMFPQVSGDGSVECTLINPKPLNPMRDKRAGFSVLGSELRDFLIHRALGCSFWQSWAHHPSLNKAAKPHI